MSEEKRRGLGRGLSALLGEESPAPSPNETGARLVPIERLHRGRFQPRRTFDEAALQALAESIAAQGVLQPLLVRRHPEIAEDFEILAGERRWRAAQRAKLHEVPVVLREMGDREALEVALVENVQREDLTAFEEAAGYQRLMEEFGHTQDRLARVLGKSRSHIANTLRLLNLPEAVRAMVEDGRLTPGHARALLAADDPVALARQAVAKNWTVRQVEQAVQAPQRAGGKIAKQNSGGATAAATLRDPNIMALERELSHSLGLAVEIATLPTGSGALTIHFSSLAQFDEVATRLRQR